MAEEKDRISREYGLEWDRKDDQMWEELLAYGLSKSVYARIRRIKILKCRVIYIRDKTTRE